MTSLHPYTHSLPQGNGNVCQREQKEIVASMLREHSLGVCYRDVCAKLTRINISVDSVGDDQQNIQLK